MPLLTGNRAHYSADDVGQAYFERDKATYRMQLVAYLRSVNAYREQLATHLIRCAYPASLVALHAHRAAYQRYIATLAHLPSWCVPPSYVAEGM